MSTILDEILDSRLQELRQSGRYKHALELMSPQGPQVRMNERDTVMLSSNNYLGLADDQRVRNAAKIAIDQYGQGTASVRFICGTMSCHLDLEETICRFIGCEAALTYISCWDANVGLIPTLACTPEDAIFSDALNHASIIDAIRLSKAQRNIFKHRDLAELESMLKASAAKIKLIITDGVFSMEGDIADLPALKELANKYQAILMVDESHATGVLGAHGRGTAEHFGVLGEGTIQTSTLGKALGGACGGYVAASRVVCDYLIQNSRPHLFSNALPPAVCGGAKAAIEVLMAEPQRLETLRRNTQYFRKKISAIGLKVLEGITPIAPVMVGDAALANQFQKKLFEQGIYVSGFGYPVVPKGEARLRCQICATHTSQQLDQAVEAFSRVGSELGLI
ncbi:MAG: 2-amino-3-ketobutyrate coenzyme A ligase [Phycisphaerae bacterium]|nr:2-amino-3-ketobutyrate coenzyme A ligase [Phycisphaerae bacterium]